MQIFNLLQFITGILNSLEIPYMLSGSVAMNFYSVTRATRDIDIVILLKENDVDGFCTRMENFYFNKVSIIEEIRKKGMFNIIDNNTGFKIDFIIRKESDYSQNEFSRRKIYDNLGFSVWVASIEDLIIAKLIWIQKLYSDRQAYDIQLLMENPDKDLGYIKSWCNELNLNTYNLIP